MENTEKQVPVSRAYHEADYRFSYIKYDEETTKLQADFKAKVVELSALIEERLTSAAKERAQEALEVAYMWIGKGLRDDQWQTRGAEPQEERSAS